MELHHPPDAHARVGAEPLGQPTQPTVGEYPDRARPLPMISATRSTASPATTRSTIASAWSAGRVATSARAARVEKLLQGVGRRVVGGGLLDQAIRRQLLGPPAGGPAVPVQDLVPGDGEHLGPERRLVALETTDCPGHRKPGLRRQSLGSPGSDHPEVAQQPGLQVVPELFEGALVASSGSPEHDWKAGANHGRRGRRMPNVSPGIDRYPRANNVHNPCQSCQIRRAGPATARRRPSSSRAWSVDLGGLSGGGAEPQPGPVG